MAKASSTAAEKKSKLIPIGHGIGRRKSSVARVWLYRSTKPSITVNGLDYKQYFDTDITKQTVISPFAITPQTATYAVRVNVDGGGKTGQSDAVKLGIARALVASDELYKSPLRQQGMLTVDSRLKERKKYGQRGARRKFQFVKR